MIMKPLMLLGAAVYTREVEPGKDYDWYITAGHLKLFDKMTEIHRLAFREIGGDGPKLALVMEQPRVSLLIGDLPSQRIDHGNRIIYDTFYLEFDFSFQRSISHAIATLLLCSQDDYRDFEKQMIDYAERLFYNPHAPQLILKTVKLPVVNKQPDFTLPLIQEEKLALFSNPINRNRCARYLIHLERHDEKTFAFLATGRLNFEKCQKVAEMTDETLLLTSSSEISEEVNLKKGTLSSLKKIMKRKFL